MTTQENIRALIYCSSTATGDAAEISLRNQQSRCKEYALAKGYTIEKVLTDISPGGGDKYWPSMAALLDHLDDHKGHQYIVVVENLNRVAKELVGHLRTREALKERGALLESPNFTFEDSADGRLMENVLAAQNEYKRNRKRSRG